MRCLYLVSFLPSQLFGPDTWYGNSWGGNIDGSRYPQTREYNWTPPDSLDSGSYMFRLRPSFGGEPDLSPVVVYDANREEDLEEHRHDHRPTPSASGPSDDSMPMAIRRQAAVPHSEIPAACLDVRATVAAAERVPGLSAEPEARSRLVSPTTKEYLFSHPSLSSIPSSSSTAAVPVVTPVGVVGASIDRPERRNISGCIARHPHIRARACGRYVP